MTMRADKTILFAALAGSIAFGVTATAESRTDRVVATIGDVKLTVADVEASFDRVYSLQERRDGSFQMAAETPGGCRIWVIWRYDREHADQFDVIDDLVPQLIFVITAY